MCLELSPFLLLIFQTKNLSYLNLTAHQLYLPHIAPTTDGPSPRTKPTPLHATARWRCFQSRYTKTRSGAPEIAAPPPLAGSPGHTPETRRIPGQSLFQTVSSRS